MAKYEKVQHPKHYNSHPSGVEAIDIIEHFTFNVGSAVKYLWRAGLKPNERDIDDFNKAVWYLQREVQRLTRMTSKQEKKPSPPKKRRSA